MQNEHPALSKLVVILCDFKKIYVQYVDKNENSIKMCNYFMDHLENGLWFCLSLKWLIHSDS